MRLSVGKPCLDPQPQHLFVQQSWTRHLTLLCLLVLISATETLSALSPGPAVTIVEAVPRTARHHFCQQGADGADKPHLGKSLYVQGTVREGSHSRGHYHGPTQNVDASCDRLREVRSLA